MGDDEEIKIADIRILNSVEAERELVERYDRLRKSPRFEEWKHKKVGEYWERSLVRAPFIEALTFRELLKISVDNLLKKRSVGNSKIVGLLEAFDRLFQEEKDGGENEAARAPLPFLPQLVSDAPPATWQPLGAEASSTAQVIIAQWEQVRGELIRGGQGSGLLRTVLLQSADGALTQEECVALWCLADGSASLASSLLGKDEGEISELQTSASSKLLAALEEHCAVDLQWVRGAISGLGASEESLLFSLSEEHLNERLAPAVLRMVLVAVGAEHPLLNGREFGGYWTQKPNGLEALLKKVRAAETVEEQKEFLETLAPQFPTEVLLEYVSD
ncbi:hypothetical protein MRY87_01270 [bacterium]|nr:hypothetical protein [bacterium]